MKEKKPKLDNEDGGSKPTNEGSNSMKKVKKKGSSSECSYCRKGFHANKKMYIISKLIENHNINVPDDLKKCVESSKHYHGVQSQGNINYSLSYRVKSFFKFSDIYSFSDISES